VAVPGEGDDDRPLTILVMPESTYGPTNRPIGIGIGIGIGLSAGADVIERVARAHAVSQPG